MGRCRLYVVWASHIEAKPIPHRNMNGSPHHVGPVSAHSTWGLASADKSEGSGGVPRQTVAYCGMDFTNGGSEKEAIWNAEKLCVVALSVGHCRPSPSFGVVRRRRRSVGRVVGRSVGRSSVFRSVIVVVAVVRRRPSSWVGRSFRWSVVVVVVRRCRSSSFVSVVGRSVVSSVGQPTGLERKTSPVKIR